MLFTIPDITNIQVIDILMKISPHITTGIDKLIARFLQFAAPVIASSVSRLIDYSFSIGSFPQRWKTAKVTPMFKSGYASYPSNYMYMTLCMGFSTKMI